MQAAPEFGNLDALVRAAVLAAPDPPRPSSLRSLLRASYASTSGKSIVGVGLLFGLPATAIELWAMQRDPGHAVMAIPAALFTIFMLIVPAFPARRASRALRVGVRAIAEVIDVRYRPPGDPTTIDSLPLGDAVRRVAHAIGRDPLYVRLPIVAHLALARAWEGAMRVPLISIAQVHILAEGVVEAAPAAGEPPTDLVPQTPFSEDVIRAGLPEPGAFGCRDLR